MRRSAKVIAIMMSIVMLTSCGSGANSSDSNVDNGSEQKTEQQEVIKDGSREHPYEFGDEIVVENVHGTINDKVYKLTITFDEVAPKFDPEHMDDITYFGYKFKLEGSNPGEDCMMASLFGVGINANKGTSIHLVEKDEERSTVCSFIDGKETRIYMTGSPEYNDKSQYTLNYIFVNVLHGEEKEKICIKIPQ